MSLTLPLLTLTAALLAAPAEDSADSDSHQRCAAFGPELLRQGELRLQRSVPIPAEEALRDGCADVVLKLGANGRVLRVDVCHTANEQLQSLARKYARMAKFSAGEAEPVALKLCVNRQL